MTHEKTRRAEAGGFGISDDAWRPNQRQKSTRTLSENQPVTLFLGVSPEARAEFADAMKLAARQPEPDRSCTIARAFLRLRRGAP